MKKDFYEEIEKSIEGLIGDLHDSTWDKVRQRYFNHLKENLKFPFTVSGIEDFRWEEFFVLGPGDEEEYEELKQTQPSYTDIFILVSIDDKQNSEWMLNPYEDIAAIVKRESDGKNFVLGLSELEASNKRTKNYRILYGYSYCFCNYR